MEICECCLFLLVNGDFSGPGTAVVEDSEGVEIAAHWACGAYL